MYASSYFKDTQKSLHIPDNYDGTALSDSFSEPPSKDSFDPPKIPFINDNASEQNESEEVFLKKGTKEPFRMPFGKDLFGIFHKFLPGFFKDKPFINDIGIEELLILGIAAFLFFSKSGDKECALMLLLLIFIK